MKKTTPPQSLNAFLEEHGGSIEEKDEAEYTRLLADNDEYVGHLQYRGNSVSWTKSKADNYGAALLDAWDALKECGIRPDGNTSVAEAIRRFVKPAIVEHLDGH